MKEARIPQQLLEGLASSRDLTPELRVMLVVLLDVHAWQREQGEAEVPVGRVENLTGLRHATVVEALNRFVAAGLLEVVRTGPKGRRVFRFTGTPHRTDEPETSGTPHRTDAVRPTGPETTPHRTGIGTPDRTTHKDEAGSSALSTFPSTRMCERHFVELVDGRCFECSEEEAARADPGSATDFHEPRQRDGEPSAAALRIRAIREHWLDQAATRRAG